MKEITLPRNIKRGYVVKVNGEKFPVDFLGVCPNCGDVVNAMGTTLADDVTCKCGYVLREDMDVYPIPIKLISSGEFKRMGGKYTVIHKIAGKEADKLMEEALLLAEEVKKKREGGQTTEEVAAYLKEIKKKDLQEEVDKVKEVVEQKVEETPPVPPSLPPMEEPPQDGVYAPTIVDNICEEDIPPADIFKKATKEQGMGPCAKVGVKLAKAVFKVFVWF